MAFNRTRTLRGALAGTVAAAVWLVQQPLDKRVFDWPHDDAELLGRLTGVGPRLGAVMHVGNGAVFGALYAGLAPAIPVAAPLRGPVAGLVEHLATWPLTLVAAPDMSRSPRAFAQATWRHLLFGVVLGEAERRLNPAPLEPVSDEAVASNGHGSAAHLVASGPS